MLDGLRFWNHSHEGWRREVERKFGETAKHRPMVCVLREVTLLLPQGYDVHDAIDYRLRVKCPADYGAFGRDTGDVALKENNRDSLIVIFQDNFRQSAEDFPRYPSCCFFFSHCCWFLGKSAWRKKNCHWIDPGCEKNVPAKFQVNRSLGMCCLCFRGLKQWMTATTCASLFGHHWSVGSVPCSIFKG